MRISNSFSEGEVQILDFIIQTLLRGGSPNMATRHKEFASLCRKVMSMRNRMNEPKDGKEHKAPEKSSVGVIGAVDVDADSDERKVG